MTTHDRAAPRRANNTLLPTLLDRLKDDTPFRQADAAQDHTLTRAQMRDIIQRDLAYLLNTTNHAGEIDRATHPAAASSVVNFGVPAIAGSYLSGHKWPDIQAVIRQAILDFEPRILPGSLQVEPLIPDGGDRPYNVLSFEIRGRVHMTPYPLEFLVQSSIDLETNRMSLSSLSSR